MLLTRPLGRARGLNLPAHLEQRRLRLADGERTTLYVARHPRATTDLRVVRLPRPLPLAEWCAAHSEPEAIVGGFFTRPCGTPLGELRTRGVERDHTPFMDPWAATRACVHVVGGRISIVRRDELPVLPRGDLLQAGPLLVSDGATALDDAIEGFSAGEAQFDSDITDGRHPRAALAVTEDELFAVVCDGRHEADAGLTLEELCEALIDLGAVSALNLDGGGSASLVCDGVLRNRPRAQLGVELPGGRPVSTALAFRRR